jgi:tyrosinase
MMSLYRGIVFLATFLLLFSVQVSAADPVLDLQKKGRPAWDAQLAKSKACTAANLKVRKEW